MNSAIENFRVTGLTIRVTGLTGKYKNLVIYVLKQNFPTDAMAINLGMKPRYCGTEIGWIDSFAEILFEIKIDVGNRVDSLVKVLTN